MAKYDRSLEFPFHYYEDPWCNVYLVEDWWSGDISNDFNQIFLWQLDIPAFRAWQMFKKEAMHCKARAWFEGHSKRKARCSFFILVGLPLVQGYTNHFWLLVKCFFIMFHQKLASEWLNLIVVFVRDSFVESPGATFSKKSQLAKNPDFG